MKEFSRILLAGLAVIFALSMVGCGSGTAGSDGQVATAPVLAAQSFDEQCAFCHGPGATLAVADVHSTALGGRRATFTAVREVNVGAEVRLEVDFRITDNTTGALLVGIPAGNIRFALAKLVPGANGDSSNWQSYINRTETKVAGAPGTTPDGTIAVQATTETATATTPTQVRLTDNLNGTYTYRFSFDMNTVTLPTPPAPAGTPINYDRAATHRIAMQLSTNVGNAFVDFIPASLPSLVVPAGANANRKIAVNASCDECHLKLGLHGGDRITVEYCVTCHNPGSTDANTGNTVDFKVMIHKIHYGAELPSVQAGGEYAIFGNNNNKNDYTTVLFPQDVRSNNCSKCHTAADAATPQGDNWKDFPTMEACGSCHDRTSFVAPPPAGFTLHTGGAQANNLGCADCHAPAGDPLAVQDEHVIPEQAAAGKFQFNIVNITNTAPGQFPVVTFSVTDPTNANAPYDILTDPEFRAPAGASRVAILISWSTKEYTNTGSGTTAPAQPISINPLVGAVNNGNGTFTVTSTVPIPLTVTGSGAVAIEGHPAVETVPGSGTFDLRVPVTGVVKSFAITDAIAQDRRTVVDIARCNQCHSSLSLHGANRNNNIQLCVICHNANATDLAQRPVPGPGIDGKAEEAIDMKRMIHGIHSAKAGVDLHGFRTEGLVVYGFGGNPIDFSHIRMPSGSGAGNLNIKNCLGCHVDPPGAAIPPTNELPSADALPTTTGTGSDRSSPDDDVNITPIASVCSSCHDNIASTTHMSANGAVFDFKAFAPVVQGGGGAGGADQAALCGPGPVGSQPAGHTARTDCCSCHSPR
ncbi:MAG: OmcA/MtrC family decaheme c-type cytochrome [Deltaproteobacteria bacterium]